LIDFTVRDKIIDTTTIEEGEDLTLIFLCDKPGKYFRAICVTPITAEVE